MISRRRFTHILASGLLTAALGAGAPGQASADEPKAAGAFLDSLTERAIEQLTDTSLEMGEREQRFRVLFREGFEIRAIGRFVLGRYWRGTSKTARDDFLVVFEDVLVQRFAPQFAGYGDTRFEVGAVRPLKGKAQYLVSSTVKTADNKIVKIDWRVRRTDDRFKVLDIIGEGASMALTLRSEYGSVLKSSGGRVEGLTAVLREKLQGRAGVGATTSASKPN
jgi:phospholipid transport system substrate-binding protein